MLDKLLTANGSVLARVDQLGIVAGRDRTTRENE